MQFIRDMFVKSVGLEAGLASVEGGRGEGRSLQLLCVQVVWSGYVELVTCVSEDGVR